MGIFKNIVKSITKPTLEPFTTNVVGMPYCQFNIEKIGKKLKGYNLPPEKMIEYGKPRYYEFYFDINAVDLIPEPTNPEDPNAIMVIANGEKIGYISSHFTQTVKPYLSVPCTYELSLRGGRWKEPRADGSIISGDTPYSAEIKITPVG